MAKRVLIVDDTPGARFLMKTLLADRGGLEVTEAANGEETLQQLQTTSPDLIILDYMMPDIDGPELLQQIRQTPATANIPVVMLTARVDFNAREQSIAAGANRFIIKPIKPLQFLEDIQELLEQQQSTSSV